MAIKFSKDNKGIINNDYSLTDMRNHSTGMIVDTGSTIRGLNEENKNYWQQAQEIQSISSFTVNSAQLSGLNLKNSAKLVGGLGDILTAGEFVDNLNNGKIDINNAIETIGSAAGYVIPGADTALTAYSIAIGKQGYLTPDDFSPSMMKGVAKEIGNDIKDYFNQKVSNV